MTFDFYSKYDGKILPEDFAQKSYMSWFRFKRIILASDWEQTVQETVRKRGNQVEGIPVFQEWNDTEYDWNDSCDGKRKSKILEIFSRQNQKDLLEESDVDSRKRGVMVLYLGNWKDRAASY